LIPQGSSIFIIFVPSLSWQMMVVSTINLPL
jgi:hypothetical protein